MNAEEVCAMIDAISEGREYEYKNNDHSVLIVHPDEGVLFSADFDTSFDVSDERTAREIAAALVAWADRKSVINGTVNETTPLSEYYANRLLKGDAKLTRDQVNDGVDFYLNKLRNLDGE